VVDHEVC